jgi:hypothetical protein
MLRIAVSVVTVISLCLLLILLNYTAPISNGPFGILAVFACIYVSLFGILSFFIYLLSILCSRLATIFHTRKPFTSLCFIHACFYASIIAGAPILIIGLQSVGSIGFYEFVLILFFVSIGCLYISKKI